MARLRKKPTHRHRGTVGRKAAPPAVQRSSLEQRVAEVLGVVDNDADACMALLALHPSVQAAGTAIVYSMGLDGTKLNIGALVLEIERQAQAVEKGELSRVEKMLAAQLHVLDVLFGTLARKAGKQSG